MIIPEFSYHLKFKQSVSERQTVFLLAFDRAVIVLIYLTKRKKNFVTLWVVFLRVIFTIFLMIIYLF